MTIIDQNTLRAAIETVFPVPKDDMGMRFTVSV